VAVKRTRKKSITKKDQNDSESQVNEINDNTNSFEQNKNSIKEVEEYNIYDAETEFKLKEVFSKDNKIIIGPPRLTRFEKARITGARSLQLSLGAPTLSQIPNDLTDTILIAKYELDKKTLPISIRRVLPNGLYQDIPIDWTVN
jgi:DNA-directed RNA polymerase I, II, and III subunit RPABC2